MRSLVLWLSVAALLLVCTVLGGTSTAADPTPASARRSECPSLLGTWNGAFEGAAVGSWNAEFTEAPDGIGATATIFVAGFEAMGGVGSARLRCEDGVVALVGEGKAGNRQGFFDGVAHRDGRYLVGTWSSGSLSGTWNGER